MNTRDLKIESLRSISLDFGPRIVNGRRKESSKSQIEFRGLKLTVISVKSLFITVTASAFRRECKSNICFHTLRNRNHLLEEMKEGWNIKRKSK